MKNREVSMYLKNASKMARNTKGQYLLQMFAEDGSEGENGASEDKGGESSGDESKGKTYTDQEVDAILEKKFQEWQKKQEKLTQKQKEAERLKGMNDKERADQLQKQVDELLKKESLSNMAKEARTMLSEKNISVSDAIVSMLVNEDADKTKEAVEAFAAAFQTAVKDAVKDALKGKTPSTGAHSNVTKEEIMKVTNRSERQRLIRENMHLFNSGK